MEFFRLIQDRLYANKTQTVDSRLHIDITASDDVSIKSWTNVSSVGSQINFSKVFAKQIKKLINLIYIQQTVAVTLFRTYYFISYYIG